MNGHHLSHRILPITMLGLCVALFVPPAFAQTSKNAEIAAYQGPDREQRLVEGAKKEMELTLYREYRDVVGIFKYVVETDRRFYLCNQVDVKARTEAGEVFFEVTLTDAWVWDMYRPARRLAKNVKVLTFKDVNVEELSQSEIEPPPGS